MDRFINVHILNGHVISCLKMKDNGTSGCVEVPTSCTASSADVHVTHRLVVMGDSEVFVVTWHGEKGCAENVRAIDRRRECPLMNVVSVAVVCDDGIETDVLSNTEICEMVS